MKFSEASPLVQVATISLQWAVVFFMLKMGYRTDSGVAEKIFQSTLVFVYTGWAMFTTLCFLLRAMGKPV